MSRQSKKKSRQRNAAKESGKNDPEESVVDVKASGWQEKTKRPGFKAFPVSGFHDEPVRIHMTRDAYGEVTSHAKSSLDAEICGVLVGRLQEDDRGLWVDVQAALRGTTSKQGSTHVTYTAETWEEIYNVKEKDFPKLDIVGWYHSHPGFGVEFSDMDLFVQQNFFSGRGQLALVIDPLGGDEAICANVEDDIAHIASFWVDGRERTCRLPASMEQSGSSMVDGAIEEKLRRVEERLNQLLQATEEQRTGLSRFLMTLGMFVLLVVAGVIGVTIARTFFRADNPPEMVGVEWLPVKIYDDQNPIQIGIGIHKWKIPPDVEQRMRLDVLRQIEEAAQRQKEAQEKRKQEIESKKPSESGSEQPKKPGGAEPEQPKDANAAVTKKP